MNEEGGGTSFPQYYKENYFSTTDTLFYTEQAVGHYGVQGDPIPYTIRGDSVITILLIVCFVVFVISVARTRGFLFRQMKRLFHTQHNDSDVKETSGELHFQFFLIAVSCLLMGITIYHFVSTNVEEPLIIDSEALLMMIFSGVFACYFLLKGLIYAAVNSVFFEPRQNKLWMNTLFFLNAGQGALLFPIVMLVVYFNLSLQKAIIFFVFTFIFIKIVTFYKSWVIFFRQNGVFMQTFLYFCALEITPLLCLAGGLMILIEQLKLNY